LSEQKIKIYSPGDANIWIPVSSHSPQNDARAFIPFNGITGNYTYGFKAMPKNGIYIEALQAVQNAWINNVTQSFPTQNGTENQRADKWRHGNKTGSPLLGPTAGWVEIPFASLEQTTEVELAAEIEHTGRFVTSSARTKLNPERPMFWPVSAEARTFQIRFRGGALSLWGSNCASGASCLLEAAHIKSVACCKLDDQYALTDPFNSIILNVSLHALLDAGLMSFSDAGELLVSRELSEVDRTVYGVNKPLKVAFRSEASKYVQHHRSALFRAAV
jgi:hypothetical protein